MLSGIIRGMNSEAPRIDQDFPAAAGEAARQLRKTLAEIALVKMQLESALKKERNPARREQVAANTEAKLTELNQARQDALVAMREGLAEVPEHTSPEVPRDQVDIELPATEDPYRLAGQPLPRIVQTLQATKGWAGVENRINRHYGSSGTGITAEDYVQDLARQIQSGMRPLDGRVWQDVYDRYDSQGQVIEESKLRQPDLPSVSVSGYDKHDTQPRSDGMPNPEHNPSEPPAQNHQEAVADDLEEILAQQGGYQPRYEAHVPRSPLEQAHPEASTSQSHGYNARATEFARQRPESQQAAPRATAEPEAQPAAERVTAAETEAFERAWTAEFGGQSFERGEKVVYKADSGRIAEYYVLCNSFGDPPGLVVQSTSDESMVFAIGGNTEAGRVRRVLGAPGEDEPGPPSGGGAGPGGGEPGEGPGERRRPGGEQFVPENLLERIPRIPNREEMLAAGDVMRGMLDQRIQDVAQAKEQREKLFGKFGDKAALAEAAEDLGAAYNQYLENWASQLATYRNIGNEISTTKSGFQNELQSRRESLERLQADQDLDPAIKEDRIRVKQAAIRDTEAAIDECDTRLAQFEESKELIERVTREVEIQITLELAQARTKIETAQAELKEGNKVQRAIKWAKDAWRKHPKTRLAITVGLGVASLATGFAGFAVAAAGMRAVGAGVGTELGVNTRRQWWANRSESKGAEKAWGQTDEATRTEAEAVGGWVGETTPELSQQAKTDLELFQQRHGREIYSEDMILKVLRGDPDASAEVATMLVSDQIGEKGRVQKDASSNRRAKVAAVAAATTVGLFGLYRSVGSSGRATDSMESNVRPKPPTADYDPNADRWYGMAKVNPNTMNADWEAMHAGATPAAEAAAHVGESALDTAYNSASEGMNLAQLRQLNFIIGTGARTIGNDRVAELMPGIARQVVNGRSTDQILSLYGIPPTTA